MEMTKALIKEPVMHCTELALTGTTHTVYTQTHTPASCFVNVDAVMHFARERLPELEVYIVQLMVGKVSLIIHN